MCLCVQTEVMELVQLMGGRVYRDLNVSVTHLVAGEVGSKKYLVAASLGKPILLPSWVKACWERSQDRYVHRGGGVDICVKTVFSCISNSKYTYALHPIRLVVTMDV